MTATARTTQEIVKHALQKELKLLKKAADKAKQASLDYINLGTEAHGISLEILTNPDLTKLEELKKRSEYLARLEKKDPSKIFDHEFKTKREYNSLKSHLAFNHGA